MRAETGNSGFRAAGGGLGDFEGLGVSHRTGQFLLVSSTEGCLYILGVEFSPLRSSSLSLLWLKERDETRSDGM